MEHLQLLIIGAGPGGYIAAIRAAQLGLSPVVVEKEAALGGTCLNRGCIPAKALIRAAEAYGEAREAGRFGVHAEPTFNWGEVVAHAKGAVAKNGKGVEFLFKKHNIRLIRGAARFTGPKQVTVGSDLFTADRIVIAAGSAVKDLPHIKVDGDGVWSSDHALFCETLPKSIAIIGAGAIGVEFAYIFSAFGVEVHLIEALDRLVPLEDGEVSKELLKEFRKRKIQCYPGTGVEKAEKAAGGMAVILSNGKTLTVEKVLSAVGRRPDASVLDLAKTNLATDQRGFIPVNEHCETAMAGIYAVGDIIATPMLAHTAEHEGVHAVEHIAGLHPHPIDYRLNPGCTFCEPAIASVGLTEEQAKAQGVAYTVGKFPFAANGKAVASGTTAGFVKVLVKADTHELLGAHIIGHGATDLIAEFLPALRLKAKAEDIVGSIHPHPTLCEASLEAVLDALGRSLNK